MKGADLLLAALSCLALCVGAWLEWRRSSGSETELRERLARLEERVAHQAEQIADLGGDPEPPPPEAPRPRFGLRWPW